MIDPSLKKFVPLKNRTELVLVGKFVTEVEPARAMQLGTHLPQLKTLYDQRYGFLGRHSSLFLSHQSPFFYLHHFLKRTSDIFFICIIFKMESPGVTGGDRGSAGLLLGLKTFLGTWDCRHSKLIYQNNYS